MPGPPGALGPAPICPYNYAQVGAGTSIVCKSEGGAGQDQIVRIGLGATAFWIDRYEATLVDGAGVAVSSGAALAAFPQNGQWAGITAPYHAESRAGVAPTSSITWWQANEACAASGKRLATSPEWLLAVRGTVDSIGNENNAACNTGGSAVRQTGAGTQCASAWGAEDMIGNVWEWTAEWYAGLADASPWGQPVPLYDLPNGSFAGDAVWNVWSYSNHGGTWTAGFPAASMRGGCWLNGTTAGAFALLLSYAPSAADPLYGFRCVLPQ